MKKRILSLLLILYMTVSLLPTAAFAEEVGTLTEGFEEQQPSPEEQSDAATGMPVRTPAAAGIYVHNSGNDTSGDGSPENPYATLSKAVNVAPTGATIYVMSDLTMTACARYYDKNLTITSYGEIRTVTRGDSFEALSDTARSWYNPAMIEVQTSGDKPAGLTLTNIIFDDAGKHEGTIFAQAVSDDGTGTFDTSRNIDYVQDAIIASNATVPSVITLEDGAVLRNFGGESAVRVTNRAQLVMKSGSVIEDDPVVITTRGSDTDNKDAAKGPAGAVWLQGGSFTMEAGAKIRNINGRAVYVDGGEAQIGGTISEIAGNANMWQSKMKDETSGSAIHLRGMNASAILTSTAVIKDISGGGSAIYVTGEGNRITTDPKSIITDVTNTQGIHCASNSSAQLSGEITKVKNSVALSLNDGSAALLEKEGSIHNNACATAVVYLRAGAQLTIYGKINDNTSTGNCAALYIVTNGNSSHAILETGGEICNNSNGGSKYGAAVEVQQGNCSFTMNGGKVIGNSGPLGAIQVHKGSARFIMNGGEVTGNTSTTDGEAGVYIENGTPTAELNAGKAQSVTLVKNVSSRMDEGHVYISDHFDLESGLVTMTQDAKTVAPAADSLDVKLGNAGPDSVTALTTASTAKGWESPLATFWVQRSGAATLTVGGLTVNDALPVYVLALPVDEAGAVSTGAALKVYAAQKTGSTDEVRFNLPDVSGNGCAVALTQPTADLGSVIITGPVEIAETPDAATYEISYAATYTMSDNLLNMLKSVSNGVPMTFVVELDSRLTAKKDDAGNFLYAFDGAGILDVDESRITVSPDGHTITVTCKPVDNWVDAIKEKTSVVMTLTGTGVLAATDFAAGECLNTTGHIEGTIPVGGTTLPVMIPANVCQTRMTAQTFTVTYNDGVDGEEIFEDQVYSGLLSGTATPAFNGTPIRADYVFDGWKPEVAATVTANATYVAQWKDHNPSSGGDSTTYYYFAIEKIDAQDSHALNGAKFGLYLDGKQIATATSNRSGIALFRIDESDYRKITAGRELYYQELTAPEGYILSSDKISIEKRDLTTSQTTAEKKAETVRNYQKNAPADLNGDDHAAYVHGYTDGTVKPSSNVTRAETAAMLYRLLTESRRNEIQTTSNSFSDVSADDWYNESVSTMANGKYITGYPDGTFGGNKNITRAEFAAMLVRFIGVQNEDCSFTDVSRDHWAYGCIATATKAGWVAGYTDGTFKPEQPITRAEAMTIINRVLNRGVNEKSELMNFRVWPDNDPSAWYYYEVIEASNEHEYTGSRPSENWTSLRIR